MPQTITPPLNRLTLRFQDRSFEKSYAEYECTQFLPTFRLGLLLAAVTSVALAVVDLWLIPGQWRAVWAIRSVSVLAACIVFIKPNFESAFCNFQRLATLVTLLYGILVLALLYIVPQDIGNLSYVLIIMIITGSGPLLGLGFANGIYTWIAISVTLFLVLLLKGMQASFIASDMIFITSSLIIAAIGSYRADRGRRTNYFIRHLIEKEREESRQESLLDPLCNVPNRRYLMQSIHRAMCRSNEAHSTVALIYCDIDNFKYFNDTFGHKFGDLMLQDMAARLKSCVRGADIVARIGGDEFVLLVGELSDPDGLTLIVDRISSVFARPLKVDGIEVDYKPSFGSSVYPKDAGSAEALLDIADARMYAKKRNNRNKMVQHKFGTPK